MDIVLLTIIYTGASFTQGVTGFGFGMSSVPLVALLYSPGVAVGMNAIVGTTNCFYNFYLLRKHVDYRRTLRTLLFSALFVPAGAYFLVRFDERLVFILMGLMIIVVAIGALWGKEGPKETQRRKSGNGKENDGRSGSKPKPAVVHILSAILPAVGGMLAGAFASPGPAMVPYMFARERDPYTAKANLQYYFSLISIFVIVSHVVAGNITVENSLRALPYLPLVFVFTKLGAVLAFRLGRNTFRKVVNYSLLLLGLYLILRNGYSLVVA